MTKYVITKLEIENFRSIQSKVVLNIKPGLYSIEGINVDEKCFNGSGKSSLLSALYWCLTGNTLTNEILADEVVNIKVGKNCKVSVYMKSETEDIKITRTRKDSEFGNNLLLEINGEDISCHKIADTQIRINQLLRIPLELLHSTILMTYDIKSAFADLTPQQRVHVLESIRDYSLWDKVRDEANKDIKDYNKEIQDKQLEISNFNGKLSTYNQILERNQIELKSLLEGFNLDEINNQIDKKNNEKLLVKKALEATNKELQEFSKKVYKDNSELQKELDQIVDEANKLKLDKQKNEFEVKDLQKEIDLIDRWFKEDKCPTCGKPLDRTEETINTKKFMKNGFLTSIEAKNNENKEIETKILEKRAFWAEKNNNFQNLEKEKKEDDQKKTILNQEVLKINQKMNELTLEITKLSNEQAIHNEKVEKIKKSSEEYTQEVKNLTENTENLNKIVKDLEIKRGLSDYFYKLLGAKGELRPYLLRKDIETLNLFMARYIIRFFENTHIKLELNGPAIDILIDSNGINKSVSSLSGGEKKRLNLIIQFALYDLIKLTSQVSFNILWLDEIEAQLDALGIQQLIDVIDDKSESIETVMWITNSTDVKEHISNKIICKKSLGVTEVYEQ